MRTAVPYILLRRMKSEVQVLPGPPPATISGNPSYSYDTKGYGSSWIFEPRLTWANARQRVQRSAFSLVIAASRCYLIQMLRSALTCTNGCSCWSPDEENSPRFFLTMEPPGTAVRTAVSPGHARPSGLKLSVLLRPTHAFTSPAGHGRRATVCPHQRIAAR